MYPCKNMCSPICSVQQFVIVSFQAFGCHILKQILKWGYAHRMLAEPSGWPPGSIFAYPGLQLAGTSAPGSTCQQAFQLLAGFRCAALPLLQAQPKALAPVPCLSWKLGRHLHPSGLHFCPPRACPSQDLSKPMFLVLLTIWPFSIVSMQKFFKILNLKPVTTSLFSLFDFIHYWYTFWEERLVVHKCSAPSWAGCLISDVFIFKKIITQLYPYSPPFLLFPSSRVKHWDKIALLSRYPSSFPFCPAHAANLPFMTEVGGAWRDSEQLRMQRKEIWLCPALTPCHRSHGTRNPFSVKALNT